LILVAKNGGLIQIKIQGRIDLQQRRVTYHLHIYRERERKRENVFWRVVDVCHRSLVE